MRNITIIGAGVMGEVFLKALAKSDDFKITITDRSAEKLDSLGKNISSIKISQDNATAVSVADLIILAVKPQSFDELVEEIKDKISKKAISLSIMAGVKISKITNELRVEKVIRAMPNLGAKIGKSMTVWTASGAISASEKIDVKNLFDKIGQELYVEDEEMIDKATAVSGSGPGFFFAVVEKWLEAAKELGFAQKEAEKLLYNTLEAAVSLLRDGQSPAELKKQVASKGGTTEAGLAELEKYDLSGMWRDVLQAAVQKSQKLSQ